ncbi:MAG: hypothetical protein ABGX16_23030 [Pirellulales bacterium]
MKKLKRSDCPPIYELGSLDVSKISAEIYAWNSEDAAELPLNYGSAQQFPIESKELTS